ncbi:MAG: BREX-4 system phosphatase PglZ [Muribaculaceae bacterium]|nr:BREX-4 system phosphatase PglZ [Muribaculaceae bacterium]
MDATEKIVSFNSVEDLCSAILADTATKDVNAQRYPVRFIMLNNFEAFRKLTAFLKTEIGVEILNLEDFILGDDKSLPIDRLKVIVKGITETTLLAPFSELVRFYSELEFNGFFNEIILTEDTQRPTKRIYIPVIGLQNRFNDFIKSFGRINESAPIWKYLTPKDDKVTVFVSKFKNFRIPEHLNICSLATMSDWLKFWKQQAPKDKILCGAKPILSGWQHSRPDSIFTFKPVNNAHKFLTEFMGINVPIEYVEDEDEYWTELLNNIGKQATEAFSFRAFVNNYFNRKNIKSKNLIDLWANRETSDFGRWLLKHYAITQNLAANASYLKLILEETRDLRNPEALFVNIAERILYFTTAAEIELNFAERRNLMQAEASRFRDLVPSDRQKWIEDHIVDIAQKESTLDKAKKFCTATFPFERRLFLGWYLLRHDQNFGKSELEQFYPDLLDYMSDINPMMVKSGYKWAVDYLKEYRNAKMNDLITDNLKNQLAQCNASADTFYNWFYQFQESHDLLEAFKGNSYAPDKIYWVDGLGVEYLSLILQLIDKSKSGYETIHAEIARTTIPSNTSINRFEVDGVNSIKIGDLDELAHSGQYKKYESLIAEIEIVKRIVHRIIDENKIGLHTIAIVSDHGLSSLSRKANSLKLPGKAHHEGRYIPLDNSDTTTHDDNFVVETNPRDGKRYMVALNHASLGSKPIREVHGGATPEEVLVPFLVLSNNDKTKPINYKIKASDNKVPISSKRVEFSIIPEPKTAQIIYNGKTIDLDKDGLIWYTTIEDASEGKCEITVVPSQGKPQIVEIEFFGMGFSSGSLLDDF